MGRAPCCDKQGMKKGPWAPEEDKLLIDYIQTNGHGSWRSLPKLAGLRRCGKSCRLRWTNYLRPDIKRGPFTDEEQKSIIQLHGIVGNKWSTIAAQLPGRTDNEIKNFWNTHLKKRLLHMGIDPNALSSSCATSSIATSASATRHMAQWETARLEAEARLSREYLLFSTTSAAGTTTDTTNADKSSCTASQVDDYILKLWNSEVGDAFRKKRDESGVPIIKTETEITDETDSTKVMTGVDDSSGSNVVEDVYDEAAFQIYLEFAGDELSMFHNQRSEFASLFSSDLSEASLDSAFK